MTIRRQRALERRNNWLMLALTVYVTATFVAFMGWQSQRYIAVIAGAEDDCMVYYGAYELYDVVGIEIDGWHAVECRYS